MTTGILYIVISYIAKNLLEEIFIDRGLEGKRQAFFTYSYIQGNGGRGVTEYTK